MEKDLKVSEQTAIFVGALKSFQETKDYLLEGLVSVYGDAQGTKLFTETYAKTIDDFEQLIIDNMGLSVIENITTKDNNLI